MGEVKDKVIEETISYIKFYSEYYNYPIFKKELEIMDSGEAKLVTERKAKQEIKEEIYPEKKTNSESTITVKENLDKTLPIVSERWRDCETLDSFANEIKDCPKCNLLARTRKQVVFGTGNCNSDIVVVGEAPGADEDEQGKPFVGRAGRLLTDILKAINFTREEVYICNILKCRPPENRNPLPDEISNCEPYLFKQLEMIKPKLILALGAFAAQTLLKTKEPLGRLRGKFHLYNGVKMMVTYHPAALLRNPNWKRPTWEDVQMFRNEYDKAITNYELRITN